MPKVAAQPSRSAVKRKGPIKKTAVKKTTVKKRIKPVLIDVIEDEPVVVEPVKKQASRRIDNVLTNSKKKTDSSDAAWGEIDQQKKFYSEIATQMKDRAAAASDAANDKEERSGRHPLSLYRRLVVKFVVLVLFLAAVVAYFSFSQLTISLSLKGETLNNNLLFKISGEAVATSSATGLTGAGLATVMTDDSLDPRQELAGQIKLITAEIRHVYPASGETYLGDEIVGRVRLINNYTRNQALVATTRLLTPDNKLFRIKEAVTVPAGGEVEVEIYADQPAPGLAIGPSTFTIPGLWVGLQDQIYARSDQAFSYTTKVRKYVNASDLELAARDINERLMQNVRSQANQELGDNWLYQALASPTVNIEAKIGDQREDFSARAQASFVVVAFNKDQAASLAQAKLNLLIPPDKELTEWRPDNIAYSLENYDANNNVATIKASFSGAMVLKQDATVVDPRQLTNLTAEQISTYLRDKAEIKDYELRFSPSFIKKAPSLADRIKIEINKN